MSVPYSKKMGGPAREPAIRKIRCFTAILCLLSSALLCLLSFHRNPDIADAQLFASNASPATSSLLMDSMMAIGKARNEPKIGGDVHNPDTANTKPPAASLLLRDSTVYIGEARGEPEIGDAVEQDIYPELAYRLAQNMPSLDSPEGFLQDPDLVYRTRLLQHRLRSLGLSTPADMVYYIRIFQFARDYGIRVSKLYDDLSQLKPAVSWRYFCYRYLDQARLWTLPTVAARSDKEAVFIETRRFPHAEFVIRAVVKNLGQDWMVTLVCSRQNEGLMRDIALSISENIRILPLDRSWEDVNDYNDMFLSMDFWKRLHGEKILIFQEDSILFRPGIDVLLAYDYVGSPWPSSVVDVASGVGNGGLSLRSRSVMMEILKRCDPAAFSPSTSLRAYMAEAGLKRVPEDVFFARSMELLGLGKKAPRDAASHFIEAAVPERSNIIIGGHQFWHAMRGAKWLELAHETLITQLALPENTIPATSVVSHRGGWKHVLKALINHDILVPPGERRLTAFIKTPTYEYIDGLEQLLIKDNSWIILKPQIRNDTRLVSFMHGTVLGRFPGDIFSLPYFWSSSEFRAVRSRIALVVTFTNHFGDHIRARVKRTPDMQAQVAVTHHPFSEGIVTEFRAASLLCRTCQKRLVAIGQQNRYISSIYRVNATAWQKYWLPSSVLPREEALSVASREIQALGIEPSDDLLSSVDIISMDSYVAYERFVASSVILLHVRDANANNAVLEAIAMNTPVIVNRHPAIVEYLGEAYPLFFDDVMEVEHILGDWPRIAQAVKYLKAMDKSHFMMKAFLTAFHKRVEGVVHRVDFN